MLPAFVHQRLSISSIWQTVSELFDCEFLVRRRRDIGSCVRLIGGEDMYMVDLLSQTSQWRALFSRELA